MPNITEAHVVLIKNQQDAYPNPDSAPELTAWENFLSKARNIHPQRYQVHLIVSGFSEREDARGFAENFMSYGSIFVFNQKRRPVYRLEVENDAAASPNAQE